jgi:HlyD family secretion protein
LNATVADNIAFTQSASAIEGDRMAAAARAAGLEELIAGLPTGLAERIGEHGIQLSGGERQRLGVARALYRDSPVLVLDEATSALDARGEDHVIRSLQELRGRKTIILVAHRLAVVRACDIVFEMESGRIVRRGTPEQLRMSSELFRRWLTAHESQND